MKIGLIDEDCHASKKKWGATIYPNLALCKISAWHKSRGDTIEWALPFEHYDVIYRSKIFNFTPTDNRTFIADKTIYGGTGYDIKSVLPQEIDDMQPDYTIYPNIPEDTSFGFLTRGCPNTCPWCVVPKKEGKVHPYWDIDRVANGRKNIVLMDNNILASGEYGINQLRKIIERGYRIDFNQAIDARLVNHENAPLLAQIKWIKRIRFGCDTQGQIKECERAMDLINQYGYKGEYFLYTMIGGKKRPNETDEQCDLRLFKENYKRVNHWKNSLQNFVLGGGGYNAYPYVQPYRDTEGHNEIPQWQKDMAGWANKRAIFFTSSFADFSPRKGFKCQYYLDKYNVQL